MILAASFAAGAVLGAGAMFAVLLARGRRMRAAMRAERGQ